MAARSAATIAEVRARHRDRVAVWRLQGAPLPTRPPPVTGAAVATRYLAGGFDHHIGGDWWTVVDLGDGDVGLGIGDISGHGIGAAALMGQARAAMSTAARAGLGPAEVLRLVDAQLAAAVEARDDPQVDLHRLATALYAVTDRANGALRVASAGHLPLLLRPARSATRTVSFPVDPPLGVAVRGYGEVTIPAGPGDVVVAYTDGLVEDRSLPVDEGIARLVAALDGADPRDGPEAVADRLLDCMGRAGGGNEDDIAVVVLQLVGS